MKLVFLQRQAKSLAWQPVEPMTARAGLCWIDVSCQHWRSLLVEETEATFGREIDEQERNGGGSLWLTYSASGKTGQILTQGKESER